MSRPYYEDGAVQVFCGDCRDILPTLGPVDHLISDPPYSEHVHGKSMRGTDGWKGEITESRDLGFDALDDSTRDAIAAWCSQNVKRWALVFSDTESAHLWRGALCAREGGMEYVRTLFWHKVGGTPQFTGDRPAVACEAITVVEAITLAHPSGKKRWNGGGKAGIYHVPIVLQRGGKANEYRSHETQKPERLMTMLVADFTDPGDLIMDPFGGSGTTAAAAKRLGRRCIVIERREADCEYIALRLAQGALDLFGEAAS